ncbi:hypothetical protein FRB95_003473 [Tulasnella sp. JGI-2019a]|nr:hypothetical protein FRB95_003473 [Tulasnella sp. JGI-2019a]
MDINNGDALQRVWRECAQIQPDFIATDASSFDPRAWSWSRLDPSYGADWPHPLDRPITPAPVDVIQDFNVHMEGLWPSIGYPPADTRPSGSIPPFGQPPMWEEPQAASRIYGPAFENFNYSAPGLLKELENHPPPPCLNSLIEHGPYFQLHPTDPSTDQHYSASYHARQNDHLEYHHDGPCCAAPLFAPPVNHVHGEFLPFPPDPPSVPTPGGSSSSTTRRDSSSVSSGVYSLRRRPWEACRCFKSRSPPRRMDLHWRICATNPRRDVYPCGLGSCDARFNKTGNRQRHWEKVHGVERQVRR